MPTFLSRQERYKSPFGAVSCGGSVRFYIDAEPCYTACRLVQHREFANQHTETPMERCDGGFTCTITVPDAGELIWYCFHLTGPKGSVYLQRSGPTDKAPDDFWQLTVYEETHTPQWFGDGITYQIFPDRFCRTAPPRVAGLLGERKPHWDWNELPQVGADPHTGRWNNDYYGGSLRGITLKLDYLQSLGVTTIYLNPIFYAATNHRYDTADYCRIDPTLGTEEDFVILCREAKNRGIRVILDGVFNHTGDESRYFNRSGHFDTVGAYQSPTSPYRDWFCFSRWPEEYDGWWGIKTLPAVNENAPDYREFIISGHDSVIRRWLRLGASGWRLDVADELPDDFIAEIRRAMEEEDPESYLLGEVWEDGTNKISYDQRRRYLLGRETHGLMNYPFRTAAIDYLRGGKAEEFREVMESIQENYPPAAFYGALNILGTHDTARILTMLGHRELPTDRAQRATYRLCAEERALGLRRLRLAAILLYTFPGSPTLYYGDEAGMEGCDDPMNRCTYPWGRENGQLLQLFRTLGRLRHRYSALRRGTLRYLEADGSLLLFERRDGEQQVFTAINAGGDRRDVTLPWPTTFAMDAVSGQRFLARGGQLHLTLPGGDGVVLVAPEA